jgi:hypothetical protein
MGYDWRSGEQRMEYPYGDVPFRPRNRTIAEMEEIEKNNGGLNPYPRFPQLRPYLKETVLPRLRAFFRR